MSLFKGQDQSGKLKITIQIDPIIHIQLCYSMQAYQRVLLYTEQINNIVYLTNTSLWAGFEMKNVFLISQFQEEKPFVIWGLYTVYAAYTVLCHVLFCSFFCVQSFC